MSSPTRVTDEIIFEQPVSFVRLPKMYVAKIKAGETTPSVKDLIRFTTQNTSPLTVTNLLDGADGQEIIIVGDGNTTLQHGTHIFNDSGANLLLAVNKAYSYLRINDKWIQVKG